MDHVLGFQIKMVLAIQLKNVKAKGELIQELALLDMASVAHVSVNKLKTHKISKKINSVCCLKIVTVRCGAESRENCTYFESTGSEVGPCSVKICKCDDNVCQVITHFKNVL